MVVCGDHSLYSMHLHCKQSSEDLGEVPEDEMSSGRPKSKALRSFV